MSRRAHPPGRWRTIILAPLLVCAAIAPLHTAAAAETVEVSIVGRRFLVELALDPWSRYRGLSGRERIDPRGGMLFVFPESLPASFCMRDCRFPIDLIFLDDRGIVVGTHSMTVEPRLTGEDDDAYNARLKRYTSPVPVRFALEVAGGVLARIRPSPGDWILFDVGAVLPRAR